MREYKFIFNVVCAGPGQPNLARVEELLDLSMRADLAIRMVDRLTQRRYYIDNAK